MPPPPPEYEQLSVVTELTELRRHQFVPACLVSKGGLPPGSAAALDREGVQTPEPPLFLNLVEGRWMRAYAAYMLDSKPRPPDRLDNSELLAVHRGRAVLKSTLVTGHDFVPVSHGLWKKLEAWYNAGPEIRRSVENADDGTPVLDLYPLDIVSSVANSATGAWLPARERTLTFSKYRTFAELAAAVRPHLHVPADSRIRVWYRSSNTGAQFRVAKPTLRLSTTRRNATAKPNHVLYVLVEVDKNGSWPLGESALCTIDDFPYVNTLRSRNSSSSSLGATGVVSPRTFAAPVATTFGLPCPPRDGVSGTTPLSSSASSSSSPSPLYSAPRSAPWGSFSPLLSASSPASSSVSPTSSAAGRRDWPPKSTRGSPTSITSVLTPSFNPRVGTPSPPPPSHISSALLARGSVSPSTRNKRARSASVDGSAASGSSTATASAFSAPNANSLASRLGSAHASLSENKKQAVVVKTNSESALYRPSQLGGASATAQNSALSTAAATTTTFASTSAYHSAYAYPSWPRDNAGIGPPTERGVCGLQNLGNTCYMNAALQCLSHIKPLSDFFLSGKFAGRVNRIAPLGNKGKVPEEYSSVLHLLWSGKYSLVAPHKFKDELGKWNDLFAGYRQHDSQEFLQFLLDGLHEDLNRVMCKPYVEVGNVVAEGDEALRKATKNAWQIRKRREDSLVYDLFGGQFKSRLECNECGNISATFDPYMMLSLAFPPPPCALKQGAHRAKQQASPAASPAPVIRSCGPDNAQPTGGAEGTPKATELPVQSLDVLLIRCSGELQTLAVSARASDDIERFLGSLAAVVNIPAKRLIAARLDAGLLSEAGVEANRAPRGPPNGIGAAAAETDPAAGTVPVSLVRLEMALDAKLVDSLLALAKDSPRPEIIAAFELDDVSKPRSAPCVVIGRSRGVYRGAPALVFQDVAGTGRDLHKMVRAQNMLVPRAGATRMNVDSDEISADHDGHLPRLLRVSTDCASEYAIADTVQTVRGLSGRRVIIADWGELDLVPRAVLSDQELNRLSGALPAGHGIARPTDEPGLKGGGVAPVSSSSAPARSPDTEGLGQNRTRLSASEGESKVEDAPQPAVALTTVGSPSCQPAHAGPMALDDLLGHFTNSEKLSESDMWYCPKCSKPSAADKRIVLLAPYLPPYLVLQLKRFTAARTKISDPVSFPLEGLNMARFSAIPDHRTCLVYDLYAVIHHYGAYHGGHYTATVKCGDGQWRVFNDSNVTISPCGPREDDPSAYLLFYRRRDVML